jgi:hypothetical protein
MSPRQLRFWKFYFWLSCATGILAVALLGWVQWDVSKIADRTGEAIYQPAWTEMIPPLSIALYLAILIGLYGLAYQRRINIQPIWKVFWLALIAYDGFNLMDLGSVFEFDLPDTIPEMIDYFNPRQSMLIMAIATSVLSLLFDVLNWIGLYSYAFRSEHAWQSNS